MDKIVNKSRKILLVDDEEDLIYILSILLKRMGYDVTGLTCSKEAFEMFEKNPQQFDLVITDYSMPKMLGTELAAKINSLNKNIPIILYSGFINQDSLDQDDLRNYGISHFLEKPITKDKISTVIESCF